MNSMVGPIYLALSAYGRKQTFQIVSNSGSDMRVIVGPWNACVTDAKGAREVLREWLADGKATGNEPNFVFSLEFFCFMPAITGGCDDPEAVLQRFIDEAPLQTPYIGAKNIQASTITNLTDGIRVVSLPGDCQGIAHTNLLYHITDRPEEWLRDISRNARPRAFTTRKKTKDGAVKTYTYTTIGGQPTSDYFKSRQKYTPHPRKPVVDERQRKLVVELHSMGNKSQRDIAKAVDISLYAVRKVLKEEKASSQPKRANG